MRVAVLAPTMAPAGGLCRWSRELVRSLELVTAPGELHIDVLIRTRMDDAIDSVERFGLRCSLHQLPATGTSVRERLVAVRDVGRLIAELSPGVVHTPLNWLWLLADPRSQRGPVVATAHAEPDRRGLHMADRLVARTLALRDRITLVAGASSLRPALERSVGAALGTAISLPVGTDPVERSAADVRAIDLRTELGIRPDEAVVLALTRLVKGKRVDLVLDVAELVRTEGRPVRFVICGDGPEFGPLVAEAQRRRMDGWVHFLGHVPDPSRLLVRADAVLHPSDSEGGQPFALIESLLAGTPVAAAAVGGVVDLVADWRDGRLAPPGDPVALNRALCEVLDHPDDRVARADRATRRFDLGSMGQAHLRLIDELTSPG